MTERFGSSAQQRENDPKRLNKELMEALHTLGAFDDNGQVLPTPPPSPLARVVASEIERALESGKVESMQFAKRLLEESQLGEAAGIPF